MFNKFFVCIILPHLKINYFVTLFLAPDEYNKNYLTTHNYRRIIDSIEKD